MAELDALQAEVDALKRLQTEIAAEIDAMLPPMFNPWPTRGIPDSPHFPMITGSGPQPAKWAPFNWVNTTLGNIKAALVGTYHHVSAKHAQRYLASYACRFNRRYQLATLTERLAYASARTTPHPYRVIIAG